MLFFLCTLPLWVYGVMCGSTGHDDSHITFWQAHTLIEHGQLLNYNGERLEQSSSLLLILLTASLAWVTSLSIVTIGYLLALCGAFGTLLIVWKSVKAAGSTQAWLPTLLTACTPYFAYWAWSGMETALTAVAALFFIYSTYRWLQASDIQHAVIAWIAALFLAAARPEMVVVGTAFLLCAAIFIRQAKILFLLSAFAVLMLWRHSYFGLWFPNPVYAKSSGLDFAQVQRGIDYAWRLFRHPLSAIGVILTGILFGFSVWKNIQQKSQNTLPLLCTLWVLIYAGFVVTSGGDWMKEGRFWVPLIAPLWLAICLADFNKQKHISFVRYGLLALLLAYTPLFIQKLSMGTTLWQHSAQRNITGDKASFFEMANREHLREWLALQALQNQLRAMSLSSTKPLTMMSKQMGMMNYHLFSEFGNKLRVWDMAGLVDNTLRNCTVMAQDGFDKQGLRINYRKFFERLPQAEQKCGLQAPDIIYDIYGWGETTPLPEFLRAQGYTILFNQTGRINKKPGLDITAQEVVAIKTSTLNGADIKTISVDFNQLLAQ